MTSRKTNTVALIVGSVLVVALITYLATRSIFQTNYQPQESNSKPTPPQNQIDLNKRGWAFLRQDPATDEKIQVFPNILVNQHGLEYARNYLLDLDKRSPRFAFDGNNRFAEVIYTAWNSGQAVRMWHLVDDPDYFEQVTLGESAMKGVIRSIQFLNGGLRVEVLVDDNGIFEYSIEWSKTDRPNSGVLEKENLINEGSMQLGN